MFAFYVDLSHFLLTYVLLDLIKKSKGPGRIINVGAMQFSSTKLDFDDVQQTKNCSAILTSAQEHYAASKSCKRRSSCSTKSSIAALYRSK
jgi:NAD(P)-dependent dehydrogenase (short-subunit alcohol dehydrogenase family)